MTHTYTCMQCVDKAHTYTYMQYVTHVDKAHTYTCMQCVDTHMCDTHTHTHTHTHDAYLHTLQLAKKLLQPCLRLLR